MIAWIKELTAVDIISIVSAFMTLIGLIATVVSLIKIQSVKKAQSEAQERYAKLVRVNEISNLLIELKGFFKRLQQNNEIPEPVKRKLNLSDFQDQITTNIATIEAINNAINTGTTVLDKNGPVFVEKGYYEDTFFNEIVLKAKTKVVIFCKRNTRVSKQGIVQDICKLSKRGCEVTIVATSPDISDDVLEVIRKSVPNPPKSIKDIRSSQIVNRKTIIDCAKTMGATSLRYYETKEFPHFHLVQVDDKVYWGLVNYNKDTDEPETTYSERPYLIFSQNDPFISKMLNKVSEIISSLDCFKIE